MLDKAELDFGIYRIMNEKRQEIETFLEKDLVPQVKKVLAENLSVDKQGLQKELDEAIKQAQALGADPATLPRVIQLKARLGEAGDIEGLENEVFSLLASFFKRYFDNGDFISMRRYKKDVYAIPYEGEEVKLHWANADQYYIKTSEYFRNYRFKLADGKVISFELIEAETEQNNNRLQGDKERRFAIYKENPVDVAADELKIYFTYAATDKKVKQDELLAEAFETVKPFVSAEFIGALELRPTEKDKSRTLLQKHLKDYTARNTFDYFIHKDLYGFLTRELDFYIKNEVLFIDDINTRDEQEFLKQLSKIKAVKKIGEKVITFLAQLENFQKKLWLKKKFVVETNYCITLDRIPETYYAEIAANEKQTDEWVKLFAIDEIKASKGDSLFPDGKAGFSKPLTVDFLKQNPFLVLDTAFFSDEFKWKLISAIENLDEQCNGLLIRSENFQALNFIGEKYRNNIDTIYIDPPYNTAASEIIYKNEFKHASWLSLMENRLDMAKFLLKEKAITCLAIDDSEFHRLKLLLEYLNFEINGVALIRNNPAGRSTAKGFSITHEYTLFASLDNAPIGRLERTAKQLERYDEKDEKGSFEWVNFRKHGGENANRHARPKLYYPIYANERTGKIRIPKMLWSKAENIWVTNDSANEEEKIVYPVNAKGEEKTWKWGNDTVTDNLSDLCTRPDQGGETGIYVKARLNDEGTLPVTWWDRKEYSSTEFGTNLLERIMGKSQTFSFPKSVHAVADCIKVANVKDSGIVLDFFGGSGTTAHAVVNYNRDNDHECKYILVEMGEYFNTVTKPRIQKVVYSKEWKDGKPVGREGISHCLKYLRLESYEDTLNNLSLKRSNAQHLALETNAGFKEGYMLNYMLDVESKGSLLNLEWFADPFNCHLNITRNYETQPTKIDLVETFNYLIGLVVEHSYAAKGYRVVTGKNLKGEKILVVWRNLTQHSNKDLNEFLQKSQYNPLDMEFDRIYVNGDNNVENMKLGEEKWKVVLIEEEFKKRMFEE